MKGRDSGSVSYVPSFDITHPAAVAHCWSFQLFFAVAAVTPGATCLKRHVCNLVVSSVCVTVNFPRNMGQHARHSAAVKNEGSGATLPALISLRWLTCCCGE